MHIAVECTRWHAMRDVLIDCYGEELGTWLAKRVGKGIREVKDLCIDNFGIVELPNVSGMAEFEKQREDGC